MSTNSYCSYPRKIIALASNTHYTLDIDSRKDSLKGMNTKYIIFMRQELSVEHIWVWSEQDIPCKLHFREITSARGVPAECCQQSSKESTA